MHVSVVA
ncbi:hypothetical protein D047_0069A, partial [Vibrio parahaemolyticus VPTS-2010_2]